MTLINLRATVVLMLFLSFLLSTVVKAHTVADPIPLSAALKQLSLFYRVNFLYEESIVSTKMVMFDAKKLDGQKIEDVLTGLLQPLILGWTRIDGKNYSIFPVQAARKSPDIIDQQPLPGSIRIDTLETLPTLPLTGFDRGGLTLREVKIVTASPFLQKKSDRYVLNVEKSIIGEGATVAELMDKLPGVQLDKDGKITINGKTGVSVFIDGKPTMLALDGMLSSGIERIELINNPSARYESAGSGGIINIVRRKNRNDGLNGTFSIGYGRGKYNRYNGSFNIGYKNDKFNLFLNNAVIAEKTYLNADAVSVFLTDSKKPEPWMRIIFISENKRLLCRIWDWNGIYPTEQRSHCPVMHRSGTTGSIPIHLQISSIKMIRRPGPLASSTISGTRYVIILRAHILSTR